MRIALLFFALAAVTTTHALEYSCSVERVDFNGNGIVNFQDIVMFTDCFLADVTQTPACKFADLDNSGAVNFGDYARLTDYFLDEVPSNRAAPWLQNRSASVTALSGSFVMFRENGDIDGDGLTDSIAATFGQNSELVVTRNLGDYQYADPAIWASLVLTSNPQVADIDGDGKPDVVSRGVRNKYVRI